jgi:2-polyprenyl-3-methyl-5-hydroxy-6-metoxy-1,4-benzoquinol methylase/tetratricopeptide (TPR) repeat protein
MDSMNMSAPAKEPPPELIAQLQMALKFHKDGLYAEADTAYKKAIKDYPDFPDVAHMAAIFYVQIGKNKYAITLLNKAIKNKKNNAKLHTLLGKAHLQEQEYETAIAHFGTAVNLERDAGTLELLGDTFYKISRLREAETQYRAAMALAPSIFLRNKIAGIMLIHLEHEGIIQLLGPAVEKNDGDYDSLIILAVAQTPGTYDSMRNLLTAIHLSPQRDEAKSLFSLSLSFGVLPEDISDTIKDAVSLCFTSKNVEYDYLASLWFRQFFEDPRNESAQRLLDAPDYEAFSALYSDPAHRDALLEAFFIEGVKKIQIRALAVERLLRHLRRYYLERVIGAGMTLAQNETDLLGALAIQSFINEYVMSVLPEEAGLLQQLEAVEWNASTPDSVLLIHGCYWPMLPKYEASTLSTLEGRGAAVREVAQAQVTEPLEERSLRARLRRLEKASDDVSRKVQQQYEENPYPRWKSYNYLLPIAERYVDKKYVARGKILIAGCGTGKHILNVACAKPHMDITALDLSSASLGYAMRKCREYGVSAEFLRGDILHLERLGEETFDEVECMGVLHHMQNPEAGLKQLVRLLKPGGRLTLGLYSEIARHEVVNMRDIILEKGFASDPEGIRACRDYVAATQDEMFRLLKVSPDFFTVSACRDLLFHVQEIRYTIPQIRDLLERNDLIFQKFSLPDIRQQLYKDAYPDDDALSNLRNWAEFEEKNPTFFAAMYQFTCVKKSVSS